MKSSSNKNKIALKKYFMKANLSTQIKDEPATHNEESCS